MQHIARLLLDIPTLVVRRCGVLQWYASVRTGSETATLTYTPYRENAFEMPFIVRSVEGFGGKRDVNQGGPS